MFKEIIDTLVTDGLSEYMIAKQTGTSQSTINRIRRGKQAVKYKLGVSLLALKDKHHKPSDQEAD